jgi:hypothetical protein
LSAGTHTTRRERRCAGEPRTVQQKQGDKGGRSHCCTHPCQASAPHEWLRARCR